MKWLALLLSLLESPLPLEPATEPAPAQDPQPISTLKADEWYVIAWDQPLIVLASPADKVTITPDMGPMRLRGRFAGGSGLESRTYRQSHIWLIEAAKPGPVEVILIPVGVESEAAVIRHTLVISGVGPQPPPGPDPGPTPPSPDDLKPEKVVLAIVEDALNRSPQTAKLLNSLVGLNAIKEAGHDWRIYDIRSREPSGVKAKAAAESAGVALPACVITDAKTGALVTVRPLPADIAALKSLIAEVTR